MYGSQFSCHADVVAKDVRGIMEGITKFELHKETIVGVYADLSYQGIILLLAAMKLGLRIAICPVREPSLVQNQWLKDLNVKKIVASRELFGEFDRQWFFLEKMSAHGSLYEQESGQRAKFISIIRTSGTTGLPKNAVIEEDAHIHSARSVNSYFAIDTNSCFGLCLPLHHVSGMSILFRCLLARASLYIADNYDALVHGIKQKIITHISLVPAQLSRLLDDGIDLSKLKAVIIGGDRLPNQLRLRALDMHVCLYSTYGLTETASMIWVQNCRTNDSAVLPHATMQLAPDGEIVVGGLSLFAGYIDDSGMRAHKGHLATGDVVTDLDQLQLIVRKNNRIICGGQNIQAEEVERILESHPSVQSCIVVGLAHDRLGAIPVAFIKWQNASHDLEELRQFLSLHVATYKCPRFFLPWPLDTPDSVKKPRRWFSKRLHTAKASLTTVS